MKIWFDLTNSPHVNFFAGMIRELSCAHDIILTCRDLANTIELLDINGFDYHVIGEHYGKNKVKKVWGFPVRIFQLYMFLKNRKIDVGISHSSFYSPLVSRMLGCPSIYLNDNEHAAGNGISFMFADHILVPEFIDRDKIIQQGANPKKIIRYPGVKEGIYLYNHSSIEPGKLTFNINKELKTIFIRPEPWMAQYYRGDCYFFDNLLMELKPEFNVIILPRGKQQVQYYSQKKFSGILVPETTIRLADIMDNCDLFIGAGGTMTREAAVLGIPTISTYQDSLLGVDLFLVREGFMIHRKKLGMDFVIRFLENRNGNKPSPARDLLYKGEQAYQLIIRLLENNHENGGIN